MRMYLFFFQNEGWCEVIVVFVKEWDDSFGKIVGSILGGWLPFDGGEIHSDRLVVAFLFDPVQGE